MIYIVCHDRYEELLCEIFVNYIKSVKYLSLAGLGLGSGDSQIVLVFGVKILLVSDLVQQDFRRQVDSRWVIMRLFVNSARFAFACLCRSRS